MQHQTCAFCGEQSDKLLELYLGDSADEKQPFCTLCIETNACMIPFQEDGVLDNRAVLQLVYRLVHRLLREIADLRREHGLLREECREQLVFDLEQDLDRALDATAHEESL